MKNIVLDTCVILHILKGSSIGEKCLDELINYDESPNILISTVTKAELQSIATQNSWGKRKSDSLFGYLKELIHVDIISTSSDLIESYEWIDAYSNRKKADKFGKILSSSSRVMGKNDLWIAATAMALECPLLTVDGDFNHLDGTLLSVIHIASDN